MNFRLHISILIVILNLFQHLKFNAQNRIIDSLKLALKNAKHDTTRCSILGAMVEAEMDDRVWPKYNEQLLKLTESVLKTTKSSNKEYVIYQRYYSGSLNNIGHILHKQGDIPKALEYFDKSLSIKEQIGDKLGSSSSLGNIGAIYLSQDDFSKALEYFNKGLKIREEIGDKKKIAQALSNIGATYQSMHNFQKAMDYYSKCLKLYEDLGDKRGMGTTLNNLGLIYKTQGDYMKAFEYYRRCLILDEESGNLHGYVNSLHNIGSIYYAQKKYNKSIEYSLIAMAKSKELGYPENIRNSARQLRQSYESIGNYKLALDNYELYIQMRDSINNESTRKASIKNQLKYEYEKQAAADSVAHAKESEIKNVELEKQKVEISAKKNQQYALFGGLILVMIFAGFMYNRFKVTQKQKSIIESQKDIVEDQKKLVEEKQKEILDSIHYAKRIQTALIPSDKYIDRSLRKLMKDI